MAVSAYASLVSLTHVLTNLHYRAQFDFPRAELGQVEMLQGNVHFLLEFVERHSQRKNPEIDYLWRQMAEASVEAEDTIHFYAVNQLCMRSKIDMRAPEQRSGGDFSAFWEDMETLIQKFSYIKKKLPVIEEEGEVAQVQRRPKPVGGSSTASSGVKEVAIGIDEDVVRIMDQLTRGKHNLQVFPITGMGGIGKTTLAKSVFDRPYIVEYFDIRTWLTISQEYTIKQVLLGLLDEEVTKETRESLDELGDRLYKKLFGRRYLIVLDDMWTIEVWDNLKKFFPNNETGSRIILTTRLFHMATYVGTCDPYMLNFLDEDKSWDLFCQITFGWIDCPYADLEEIGKNIAKSCRGLPIEIVVIGHLLANSNMTPTYWEFVAKNITSLGNLEDDEHCLKILSLSYESLPIHLKPCLLFMRTFPEDARISISNLIDRWIAEGFIKQLSGESLEKTANKYVRDLIDRNLIFNRSIKECGIHDLLRDLCLRESKKENFIRSPKVQTFYPSQDWNCSLCGKSNRAWSAKHHPNYLSVHICKQSSETHAYVCDAACKMMYSRIRRPILVWAAGTPKLMNELNILQPTELRYSLINFCDGLKFRSPSTIHLLWNLQFLIIEGVECGYIKLPHEIWKMPQLRHIRVPPGCLLPKPADYLNLQQDFIVLQGLQTLSNILNYEFTKDVLNRIPNLKNLKIQYKERDFLINMGRFEAGILEWRNYSLCNLAQLQKLESLCLRLGALKKVTFPNSLKKLHLYDYGMAWEDMSILGSLPSLESLKLCGSMEGSEWNSVEGEFLRLKRLSIRKTNLLCWRADQFHFPVLEWLELCDLNSLEKIPLSIGDIQTLQSMRLYNCSDSAIDSAKQIWEEQQSCGNESLRIYVDHRGAIYQIDSVTAGMTAAASTTWVHLMSILKYLQKVQRSSRWEIMITNQTETVEEYIHFLQDIVEADYQSKIPEIGTLSREIAHVASEAKREQTHNYLSYDCFERVIKMIAFIKEKLLVDKQETHQKLLVEIVEVHSESKSQEMEI